MEDRYLGDGYQIWLAANDHTNKVVALEPSVMDALKQYETDLIAHYQSLQAGR